MRIRIVSVLVAALWAVAVFGDGPPMTPEGEVTVDHLEFRLSPEQIESAGRTRYVEFTPEQLALCRKLNAEFPQRLPVLGTAYNDCTCGLGVYGMWIRPQRLAIATTTITHYDAKIEKEIEVGASEAFIDERPFKLPTQADPVGAAAARRQMIMDVSGNLFIYGKALSAKDSLRVLSMVSKGPEEPPYIFINIPPAGDPAVDAKVQEVLKVLKDEAAKLEVQVLITG